MASDKQIQMLAVRENALGAEESAKLHEKRANEYIQQCVREFRQMLPTDGDDNAYTDAINTYTQRIRTITQLQRDNMMNKSAISSMTSSKQAMEKTLESERAKRARMEALCRELQTKLKTLTVASSTQCAELTTLREKFAVDVKSLSERLDAYRVVEDDNQKLKSTVKSVLELNEQYKVEMQKELDTKDLQVQLSEAKLAKKTLEYDEQVKLADALRTQIERYDEHINSFEKAINDSKSLIEELRVENTRVRDAYTEKASESQACIQRNNRLQQELVKSTRQKMQLEKLCRTLELQVVKTRQTQPQQ